MVRNLTFTSFPRTYPLLPGVPGGPTCRCQSHCILPEESKLVISWPERLLVLLCCGVNRLIGSLSRVVRFIAIRQCERAVCEYSTSLAWNFLLRVFFFLPFYKQVLPCEGHGWRKISHTGTTVPKISNHHSGPSPMRPNEFWTCPNTEPPVTARVLGEQERRGRLAIRLKARGLALAAPTYQ